MCPVAPKTSHTFEEGGLAGEGGSVVAGRVSLGSEVREDDDCEGRRLAGEVLVWLTEGEGIIRQGIDAPVV